MFKQLFSIALAATLTVSMLDGCKGNNNNQVQNQAPNRNTNQNTVVTAQVSDGLDLSRLPEMAKQSRNAEDLERRINDSGFNNVDINQDGNVDYINVEEYRDGNERGFTLYTNEDNQEIELATISISQNAQAADMVVQGNPNYYGNDAYYQSHYSLGELLFVAWLYDVSRPRYYHKPYYYGYYPTYYKRTRVVPVASYRSRVGSYKSYSKTTSIPSSKKRTFSTTSTRSTTPKSLSNTTGTSFSATTKKRTSTSGSSSSSRRPNSGFGSSSSRSNSGFGSSSSRRSTSSSGSSSSRSSSGFGSSSSRRSSSSSSSRRRK